MTAKGDTCFFMDTLEVVPGVKVRKKGIKNTMVKGCAPEAVLPIVNKLSGGVNALLVGETETTVEETE